MQKQLKKNLKDFQQLKNLKDSNKFQKNKKDFQQLKNSKEANKFQRNKKPKDFKKFQKNKKHSSKNAKRKNFWKKPVRKFLVSFKLAGRPFLRHVKKSNLSKYSFLTFHVYPNNVFCTLKTLKDSKFVLLNTASSGKYKIKLSKKNLRHKTKFVILSFLKELKQKKLDLTKFIGIKLIAPVKQKKIIIKLLSSELKRKNFIFEVVGKKVFNGCRAKKMVRKKRRYFRKFK